VTGKVGLSNTFEASTLLVGHPAPHRWNSSHARNLISGNARAGVLLTDTEGKPCPGNFIGTDINGTSPLANDVGVKIMGAVNNVIGGTEAGARNVISGNAFYGVFIATEGTTGNTCRQLHRTI